MSEPVGSLGEEAAKLFAAAESWLHGARAAADPAPDAGQHAGPECVVCPVCQLLSKVRSTRPEVVEHLAVATTSLLQALRVVLDPGGRTTARADSPPVERIDIG